MLKLYKLVRLDVGEVILESVWAHGFVEAWTGKTGVAVGPGPLYPVVRSQQVGTILELREINNGKKLTVSNDVEHVYAYPEGQGFIERHVDAAGNGLYLPT